jgi:hypothetical protein
VEATTARVLTEFRDMLVREYAQVAIVPLDPGTPGTATVQLVRPAGRTRLSIDEAELQGLIADAARVSGWPGVPVEQHAAALMLVHLEESLATREQHESGWWTYRDGFFHPCPPSEAQRVEF